MGRSEWGFLITCKKDVNEILKMVHSHNSSKKYGEDLEVCSIIKHDENDKYYLCVTNGGGRDFTTEFIMSNYADINNVYFPFEKPEWWNNEKEYSTFWSANTLDEAMNPDKFIVTPWDNI
jgi:hypothetical protein